MILNWFKPKPKPIQIQNNLDWLLSEPDLPVVYALIPDRTRGFLVVYLSDDLDSVLVSLDRFCQIFR